MTPRCNRLMLTLQQIAYPGQKATERARARHSTAPDSCQLLTHAAGTLLECLPSSCGHVQSSQRGHPVGLREPSQAASPCSCLQRGSGARRM